jgi:iron only hydrogenase large subunit-like protein
MPDRHHAVRLIEERCKGCTNCIKGCPTEAIRVRDGKAFIHTDRCIDCGECIRVCENHAKTAVSDGIEKLNDYSVTIALPAPALYGQFGPAVAPDSVLSALHALGFHHTFEVALAADLVSPKYREFIEESKGPRPIISPACPAVVKLVQVRFPSLLDHILPIEPPVVVAAEYGPEGWET